LRWPDELLPPAGTRNIDSAVSDRTLIALNGTAGIAALADAWYALGGAPDVPTGWLDGSPFADYRGSGPIVGGVYAPARLATAWALWRRQSRALDIAAAVATVRVGWIGAEVSIIGVRSFLQSLMGGVGLADLAPAVRRHKAGRR
jgi:hypothetical protein